MLSWWLLLTLVVVTWIGWIIAGTLELGASIVEGERPEDAGFSPFPVVPIFPLILWGLARGIDDVAPGWGSRGFVVLHIVLMVVFGVSGVRAWLRIRKANDDA